MSFQTLAHRIDLLGVKLSDFKNNICGNLFGFIIVKTRRGLGKRQFAELCQDFARDQPPRKK
ncbi:hypothetical protein COD69_01350 [Bacillus thuringiensis]|nr:hypothetical protein COD69_01350 [Bacillus thuringiensis]